MEETLIPGLPYDVSLQILARVPRQFYSQSMSKVSLSWREAVTSRALFAQRKCLQVTESWVYTAVVCERGNRPYILWFARNAAVEDSQWWPLPLMREEHRPICGFSCAVIDELLFVIGGCEWRTNCTNFPATNKVSVFNARTNRWSCVEGMKDARANFACGVVNGKLFVAGGNKSVDVGTENSDGMEEFTDCNCLKSAEIYDPSTKKWAGVGNLIHAMHFISGRVEDGKLLVCGIVCEGDLQFREVAEVWEETEMRWVQLHRESLTDISMFEMDDDHPPPSRGMEIQYESGVITSLSDSCQPEFYGNNGLIEMENEEEVNYFGDGLCECEGYRQACLVITL
ncbi:hypothetical protein SUGI_0007850 [Cryptomeria japonica]|uniref:F-box/kelch-repeat protein At1g55270 n=1 Tax=Cryptomeria japonica TaxID=3369 RepID=UPI002408D73C|nr:F-box/kelch-repeat protein At1g55270 [Cryptomeria japonica]GLJ04963.1 hypothetical protein SUGI_0007850 [Cryptomeria japonica]